MAAVVVQEQHHPFPVLQFNMLVAAVVELMLAAWHQFLLALALLAVEMELLEKQQPLQQ
jgi:hypothetical protein